MYFQDLTPYEYARNPLAERLNIGWLSQEHAFPTGDTSEDFRRVLNQLATNPTNLCGGHHDCEFCESPLPKVFFGKVDTGLRLPWTKAMAKFECLPRKGTLSIWRRNLWRTTSRRTGTCHPRRLSKLSWHLKFKASDWQQCGALYGKNDFPSWKESGRSGVSMATTATCWQLYLATSCHRRSTWWKEIIVWAGESRSRDPIVIRAATGVVVEPVRQEISHI